MFSIKTANHEVELKAKSRFYLEFKLALGCPNLKQAFFVAFENVDVEFLAKWIKAFAVDRKLTLDNAYDIIDEYIEDGEHTLYDLFSDCADFINGMGFFGKLELSDGESVIAFFENRANMIDMNGKISSAIDSSLDELVSRELAEQMAKKK
jgi:hypothetical protein